MSTAIRFRVHKHGPAGSPQVEAFTPPDPDHGQVRLALRAMALNYLDLWTTIGVPGHQIPLPLTPGSDGAGVIDAVGPGTQLPPGLEPGSSAMIAPGLSCGLCASCLGGDDNRCATYGVLGHVCDGTAATHVLVPAANLLPIPGNWSFEQAAAFPLVFLTVWEMLVRKAGLHPGEWVLVWGGGSGVGTAAIQLARFLGARPIAVVGSEEKGLRCWDLGAEHVIVRGDLKELVRKVREITEKRGVDVVFEHTGALTWEASVAVCARGGRVVTCGATTGHESRLDLRVLFAKQLTLMGSYMGRREHLWTLLGYLQRNPSNPPFAPVIERTFPLSEYPDAQRHLKAGLGFGKVVCSV